MPKVPEHGHGWLTTLIHATATWLLLLTWDVSDNENRLVYVEENCTCTVQEADDAHAD